MISRILKTVPLAVLVDRSRDVSSAEALIELTPKHVFLTTDSRRRLTARRLADYDVVAVCGNGATPYSAAERRAVRAFVKRGGRLLLAACSGAFELATERSAEAMAANGLAGLFGFEFLSASDLPPDVHAVRGCDREELELTAAGKRKTGLTLGETPLHRPGPLLIPRGAQVLMRAKRTGQPIAATARFGRGRVMAYNDLEVWGQVGRWWTPWPADHWIMPIAPRRRTPAKRPADTIELPYTKVKGGRIAVHCTTMTRGHAARVGELVCDVLDLMLPFCRMRKKPKTFRVRVDSGCGAGCDGCTPQGEMRLHVGDALSDAAMAANLTAVLVQPFLFGQVLLRCF